MHNPNDPELKSWIEVPRDHDFPIQNLPVGIFSTAHRPPSAGMAIGNHIIDLHKLGESGYFADIDLPDNVFNQNSLNKFLSLGRKKCGQIRTRVSELLKSDNKELQDNISAREEIIIDMANARLWMPVEVKNYTDFYSSKEHATNVGSMFRDPANALLPNWKYLPVAYHGRASSIIVSDEAIRRPLGQRKDPKEDNPVFGPTQRLDFELEMAFVTCKSNSLGTPVPIEETDDYIFGFCLFNDWSARDIQTWEYVPLGPFLAKNFASSISPWIIFLDALEPFRIEGPVQDPKVFKYLQKSGKLNFDIHLEVFIKPEGGEESKVCHSNFKHMYWNVNQQLAHHTVNGCNIQIGDMYASGTISGPTPDSYGSMLELAWRGTKPIKLIDGSERSFILDGDEVIMRGYSEKEGVRIGFGEVRTKVLPSIDVK